MLLVVDPVGALHFQVEALLKHPQPFAQQRLGGGRLAVQQGMADFAFLGTGQRDQAFGGGLDPIALDDHLVVALPLGPAARHQLGQVAVALGVHRQQGQARQRTIFVGAGQPDVGAADRLDPAAHGRLVELHQRAHVAHVGDRHRRHARARHGLDQRFDPHQTVDQGEFGVQTQMDERSSHGSSIQNTKTTRRGLYSQGSAKLQARRGKQTSPSATRAPGRTSAGESA
ncbi:hypothetical protein D3C85_527740 [compost metagenome]